MILLGIAGSIGTAIFRAWRPFRWFLAVLVLALIGSFVDAYFKYPMSGRPSEPSRARVQEEVRQH